MKNHIVSQMIIKRFSEAINIFDVQKGFIDINKRPQKVFYINDRLSEDLESIISQNIESRFANLLYGKLNDPFVVKLTREELFLIKRYLLMISVRMYDENEFYQTMKNFSHNAENFLIGHPEFKFLKRNNDLKLSPKELYELALRIFCENKTLRDICLDKRITLELLCWAKTFIDSYLAIWDAPEGMEYILSDCSMLSEYEGVHELTGGLDLSKYSYCFYSLKNSKSNLVKMTAVDLLSKAQIMYENYNVFNLSSKRSLVLINPFFRQYFNQETVDLETNESEKLPTPDIWPSIIQNKKLFQPPIVEYKSNIKGQYTDDDIFFYETKTLNPDELVYINSLIIRMTHNIFGFNDFKSIKDSIDYMLWMDTNLKSGNFFDLETKEDCMNFCDKLMNSTLMKLSRLCGEPEKNRKSYPIDLFNKVCENMVCDFNSNKYIYWYLLSMEEQTKSSKNLAFLGTPEERIKKLKEKYKELWGKEYDQ